MALLCSRRLCSPNVSKPERIDLVSLAMRSIADQESSMLTAMERLERTRLGASSDSYLKDKWYNWASVDIEYWHMKFRSLLNQAARVMIESVDQGGANAKPSFRRLYQQSSREATASGRGKHLGSRLGEDWSTLLRGPDWFDQIVSVRDGIVHRGGYTMVFSEPSDGILFQVHGHRYRNLISNAPLMFNPNAVIFERYSAHLMSHLMIFLEKFSGIAGRLLFIPLDMRGNPRSLHSGYETLKAWMHSTIKKCEELAGQ